MPRNADNPNHVTRTKVDNGKGRVAVKVKKKPLTEEEKHQKYLRLTGTSKGVVFLMPFTPRS